MSAAPGKYDFTLYQGATLRKAFTWKINDVLVNLTNYTARCQFRPTVDSATVILNLTTENTGIVIDGPAGTFTLVAQASQTDAITTPEMVYDVELVGPTGDVTRVLAGKITLSKSVTR